MTATDDREQTLAKIARRLGVNTLESRGSDDADFHDINVELLRDALERAYEAGRASALPGVGGAQ